MNLLSPLLAASVATLGLTTGSNNYSTIGVGYSDGYVQQSISRITNNVSAAYAASGEASITKPADLFPSPRFVPGNQSTGWSLLPVDNTHVTFCLSKKVNNRDEWAAATRGISKANLSTASDANCTPASNYPFPASFPTTVFASKTLVRAAPATATQKLKVSGLPSSGVGNVYGGFLFWGPPLVLTVSPATAMSGTYSLTSSSASDGFGVQSTCRLVAGGSSCYVYIYYAALRLSATSTGSVTLNFSTGDKVTIPVIGHFFWS